MSRETLEGQIHSVVYNNEENGWAVLRLTEADGSLDNVVGCVPFAAPGERLKLAGRWVTHPTHGSQFAVELVEERALPDNEEGILEYLCSGAVQGVGRATARLFVTEFGTDTLRIMETDAEQLTRIKGMTSERAERIGRSFRTQCGNRRLMELLSKYELSPSFSSELTMQFGSAAIENLHKNPYILAHKPYNAPFGLVDRMAEAFGVEDDDNRRRRAGLTHELEFNLDNGHAYIPRTTLQNITAELLSLDAERLSLSLDELLEEGALICPDGEKVYLPELYNAETAVADFAARRSASLFETPRDMASLVASIESELQIRYADKQKQAVTTAAERGLMILTGGPGTGKTTTVKGILRLYEHMGLKVLLAAPTGRAAKRLSELTERSATTIHRLLEYGFNHESGQLGFGRCHENPLTADAVVVDECSMVDVLLMESILDALKENARLILIGDPDQLPAVGPGNVLEDLLQSGCIPAVRLTEIFRQAALSRIITGAHSINRGEMPSLQNEKESDFFFMRRNDIMPALDTVRSLCATRLPAGLSLDPSQIQVLSPTRKGPCGTVSLNKILQEALNPPEPGKREKRYGEYLFREGDRVMQVRNNYNISWRQLDGAVKGMGIFNGEIGIVRIIDDTASLMTVQFDDREAGYPYEALGELEPAFAMTVHKAQGSEYEAVVLALMPGAPQLMTRRVLYTAVTRARRYLVVVGQEKVLVSMVDNARRSRRFSGLAQWITEKFVDD